MPRVTITVPDKTPQPYRFDLNTATVTLGRGSDNDIVIECGSVSTRHAEMCRVDGGFELRDLASTNGIRKNGARAEVIPLLSGDHAKLGDIGFDFQLSEDELAALAAEKPAAKSTAPSDSGAGQSDGEGGKPALRPPQRPTSQVVVSGGGIGFGMVMLFIVLALAAFIAGLSVRHQNATGGSLIDAIQKRINTPISPPAEDAPDGTSAENGGAGS